MVITMMNSRLKFSLASGFFVQIVLRIDEQRHGGRKVIWQAGRLAGGPKVTISLDHENRLFFSVTSQAGEYFATPSVARDKLEGFVILWCWLEHFSDHCSRLSIAINGTIVTHAIVDGGSIDRWGYEDADCGATMFGDIEGLNASAGTLMSLLVSGVPPNEAQFRGLLDASLTAYKMGPFDLTGNYGDPQGNVG